MVKNIASNRSESITYFLPFYVHVNAVCLLFLMLSQWISFSCMCLPCLVVTLGCRVSPPCDFLFADSCVWMQCFSCSCVLKPYNCSSCVWLPSDGSPCMSLTLPPLLVQAQRQKQQQTTSVHQQPGGKLDDSMSIGMYNLVCHQQRGEMCLHARLASPPPLSVHS